MPKILFHFFLSALFLFEGCAISFKSATNKNRDFPDQVLGDFKYISADAQGQKEWELRASEAKMYNSKNEVYLFNLVMTFYNWDGTVKSFLSANNGLIQMETMNVFTEGKVKILSENRSMMEANKVYWDNKKKQFYTAPEELVTLWRGNSVTRGYNMVADNELKQVTMDNPKANLR